MKAIHNLAPQPCPIHISTVLHLCLCVVTQSEENGLNTQRLGFGYATAATAVRRGNQPVRPMLPIQFSLVRKKGNGRSICAVLPGCCLALICINDFKRSVSVTFIFNSPINDLDLDLDPGLDPGLDPKIKQPYSDLKECSA